MAVPIIRQLKAWAKPDPGQMAILDAPPGTSCPVVETVRGADYLVLVTEPTPFGLHDLRLAVGVAQELGISVGVVINRYGLGDNRVDEFCAQEGLPVLLRIPYDRRIAEAVAQGSVLVRALPEYQAGFERMLENILKSVAEEAC